MDSLQPFLRHLGMWDVICLAVLGFSVLMGMWRGLVYQVMALLTWVAAFFGAQWGAVPLQQVLMQSLSVTWGPQALYLLAFALVFVGIWLLAGMLAGGMGAWVRTSWLGPVDRLLGMVFGAVRAVVLLWVVAVAVLLTPLRHASWWMQSQSSVFLVSSLQAVAPLLPPAFREWLPEGMRRTRVPLHRQG